MQKKRRFKVNSKVKISKTIRNSLIILFIAIIVFAFLKIIKATRVENYQTKEIKEIYEYTNKGNIDAKINLIDNQFVDENEVLEGQVYLSDLIDSIDFNIDYNYTGNKKEDIKYNYKIEAIVNAAYENTQKSYDVLNKVEVLKESDENSVETDIFEIKENINVNYDQYHQLIKEFKKTMSMNVDSNLIIRLTVNSQSMVNSKNVNNKYVIDYKISLGDKVALIEKGNANDKLNKVEEEISIDNNKDIKYNEVCISMIFIVLSLCGLTVIIRRTEELRVIKNEFKVELNRILKSYEDKIVEIQDLHNIDVDNATKVKDILQLRKLAEESLLPIYCYIKDEKEAYFIVTKYENNYVFILK